MTPGSNPGTPTKKKITDFSVIFFLVGVQEDIYMSSVGIRWAQRYEASKPNRERRPASPTSGDEEELVGEIPGTRLHGGNYV